MNAYAYELLLISVFIIFLLWMPTLIYIFSSAILPFRCSFRKRNLPGKFPRLNKMWILTNESSLEHL